MNCKVICYYTNDFYQQKSVELTDTLDRFGVMYETKKVTGPETWQQAVSHKPQFILDCLLSSACDGLLYTDADSKLLRAIPYGDLIGDVAYVPFKRSLHHEEETLTGTLYFKNTMQVRSFVLQWIEATAKYQHTFTPEQYSLKETIANSSLLIQRLGPEWCWIFDDFKELFPNAQPTIWEHYQASREYKEREAQAKVSNVQREGFSSGRVGDASEWTRAKGNVQ